MISIDDLTALLKRAKKTAGPDRELDCAIAVAIDGFTAGSPRFEGDDIRYWYFYKDGVAIWPGQAGDMLVRDYTSSMDAVLALSERIFPGEWRNLLDYAMNGDPMEYHPPDPTTLERLPLAMVCAIIETLLAREGVEAI